jgi:hypothetical protein
MLGCDGACRRCLRSSLWDKYDASNQNSTIRAWNVRVDVRTIGRIANLGLIIFWLCIF